MTDFCELWPQGPVFCQSEHFRLGTDSVLLADFVNTGSHRRGVDLGCGSGAISLLLLSRTPHLEMTGVEILPAAAEVAEENLRRNGLEDRGRVITGDLRESRKMFKTGEFDFAVSNPPYFPAQSGYVSPKDDRAGARTEENCTLADICSAAAFLLHTGGAFFLVHKPERLSEIFCAMTAAGIEPKRLRAVQHTLASAPSLVLIEGRRGGNPGLKVEAPLILHTPDGGDSDEARRIYHL